MCVSRDVLGQGADAVEAAFVTHSVAAVEQAADEFVMPLVQVCVMCDV